MFQQQKNLSVELNKFYYCMRSEKMVIWILHVTPPLNRKKIVRENSCMHIFLNEPALFQTKEQ